MSEADKGQEFPRSSIITNMINRYQWQLITDLLGGTTAMRAASNTYVPQFENEPQGKYDERLNRTTLFGAFEESVENIVDKPFGQDITYKGSELDARLERLKTNADANGTPMQDIGQTMLRLAGSYGHVHVITDAPKAEFENRKQELDTSPFVRVIPANRVRQWTASNVNGKDVVSRFMYEEEHITEEGHSQTWLREWTITEISLYRPVADGDSTKSQRYVLAEDPTPHTFGSIPLTTYYTRREGVLQSKPPLLNVAELNAEHWTKSCDQNNILHYARVPMLWRSGITEDEASKPFTLSAAKVASSTSSDASMHWVELVGNQIKLGFEDQERIEKRMEVLAGKVFVPRNNATRTATGERNDSLRGESRAQTWIRNLETALQQIFSHAAQWVNKPLPEDFVVDVFNDFAVGSTAVGDGKLIQEARFAGHIDHETYINEMKRRGILSDDADSATIIDNIREEGFNSEDNI